MSEARAAAVGRPLVLFPPFLWLALFFLAPFAIVLKISLSEPATAQPPYRPQLPWSLDPERWRAFVEGLGLENYRTLLADDLYWGAGLASLGLAAVSTLLLLAVGYPIALAMARASAAWRPILVALIIVPFWTSLLIRVYAWMAILSPEGFLNRALLALGIVGEPLQILNTNAAVLLGLVYSYLPFMILPLYASLERQDPTLAEAASDLGASPLVTFWTVTFPLSRPGIVAGALLCFIPIVGEFIVPDLLGGSETLMLGRTLWSEFFSNRDWPLASAVAVVMTVLLVGPIVAYRNAEARRLEPRG
ncbi:ABC transporter permease [Enterovirga aerilata]|uniref:ABC transporter permease subunit n=1 Tax=Enterovirga aerilata TaxID=2730920 RepID=A0A849I601_9HYPH|nr:ABC transporter permease subunit [Enterovirga sp. DB1703]NNM71467.1 ABC transporter permease subunit [Enterovirga sp. DB1703]